MADIHICYIVFRNSSMIQASTYYIFVRKGIFFCLVTVVKFSDHVQKLLCILALNNIILDYITRHFPIYFSTISLLTITIKEIVLQ